MLAGTIVRYRLGHCVGLAKRFASSICIDSFHVPILSDGFAVVNTPYTTHIKPLDPTEYIEDDNFLAIVEEGKEMASIASARVSLNLHVRDEMQRIYRSGFKEEFIRNICFERRVVTKSQRQFLEVSCQPQKKFPFPEVDISLTLEIPVQLNFRINAYDFADVYASNLEGGWQNEITTDKGNCHLKSIKATDLHIKTNGGDIICPTYLLAEFGTLETENSGKISVEKLQGHKFCLDTEMGDIHAGSIYVIRGEVKSQAGNIKLGDIHGDTEVKVRRSDINIGSVSGDLNAATANGSIYLHLSQFNHINLKSNEGDICITMDPIEPCTTSIMATAGNIDIEPSIPLITQYQGEGSKTMLSGQVTIGDSNEGDSNRKLNIQAKCGSFKMGLKDWFSSLNLNGE